MKSAKIEDNIATNKVLAERERPTSVPGLEPREERGSGGAMNIKNFSFCFLFLFVFSRQVLEPTAYTRGPWT